MAPKQVAQAVEVGGRYADLKRMLAELYTTTVGEVKGKIRGLRMDGANKEHMVSEAHEFSGEGDQEDIEWALVQMKAETLNKINEALARLEDGTYGNCFECGDEIAQPRLRALPFAVRCKDCEDAREMAQQQERVQARRRSGGTLI